jgi:ribonuclease-3
VHGTLDALDAVATRVGLAPTSAVLVTALTHSSYAAEHETESNERLEFLGDAVVGLAVADLIVREYPQLNEGTGSLVRSRVVNEGSLARCARALGLREALRVGRGVQKENGTDRPSLLADAFEAVVAAIYLERDYDAARAFVRDALAPAVADAARAPGEADPKTQLLRWAKAHEYEAPVYTVTADGPSHAVNFVATVRVGPHQGTGEGRSKKVAEANAAARLWGVVGA